MIISLSVVGVLIVAALVYWIYTNSSVSKSVTNNKSSSELVKKPPVRTVVDFTQKESTDAVSKAISASEKQAAYEAILKGYKVITSGDAKAIRTYMLARVKTDAEKKLLSSLSDSDLVSLSIRLAASQPVPDPAAMTAPDAIWRLEGNMMTVQFTNQNDQQVTMTAIKVDGKWY